MNYCILFISFLIPLITINLTFEEYCKERWGFTRMRASQLIAYAKTIENVNQGLQKPTSERQLRPLTFFNLINLFKNFLSIAIPKNFGATKQGGLYTEGICISIQTPEGGRSWVFDSQTTPSPWNDPLSASCPMTILLKNSWSAFSSDVSPETARELI